MELEDLVMKLKKMGKIAVLLGAATALVATLVNDKKNKEGNQEKAE